MFILGGGQESPQVVARIEQLPFEDDSFEVIISQHIFDSDVYNQDHDLMMQEINRVLKPGGVYIGLIEKIKAKIPTGFVLDKLSNIGLKIYKKS